MTAEVIQLADRRQLGSWIKAVRHLNALGLPAAVPAHLVLALQRRGLRVWAASAR